MIEFDVLYLGALVMNSEERRSRRRELYRLRRERETTEEREERLARQRDIDVLVKRNNKEKEI